MDWLLYDGNLRHERGKTWCFTLKAILEKFNYFVSTHYEDAVMKTSQYHSQKIDFKFHIPYFWDICVIYG